MIYVTIDDVETKDFYELTLEQFDIGMPEPKLTTVNIPGRDGELDMSRALTGHIHYHPRVLTLQFGAIGDDEACELIRLNFMKAVQGRVIKLQFSHLSGYFKGRSFIDKVTRDYGHYTLVLRVVCEPYRFLPEQTTVVSLTTQKQTVNFNSGMMPVSPLLTTTHTATIIFKQQIYTVSAGEHRLPIVFIGSRNVLEVTGTGQLTIKHAVGVL